MKRYIGDGCYVEYDGYGLVLTTEDGIRATNRIVLEPDVYSALIAYVDDLRSGTEIVPIVSQPYRETGEEN